MSDRPLLLLDSASMYFRAYFGVPESITAPDGTPVNAVRGFTDMISRLVTEQRPSRLVACLDLDWRPAFRVAALPSYKAHRVVAARAADEVPAGVPEEVPDTLGPQVPVIMEVLAAAGICTAGADGHEADDVIGTLADRETADPVLAVSGDRDLMQIVRDPGDGRPRVRLLYIGRGLNKAEDLGPDEVAAKYDLPRDRAGAAYAEMAMLRGDPSDGLPGVPGVGAKTAATLVGRFGSWAELLAAVTDGDPRLAAGPRAKMTAARDYLDVVEPVVRVVTDAPVRMSIDDTALPAEPVDPARLDELAERWGLESSVARLRKALAAAAS
ncbi:MULTISPECIES: 5'-3' exonuclease [unclassified Pseudonocardia]|uniref:5'-3' exonuclease n=1 Tax=unclassified Pseudonocardia TaxID=2619320 RepID=UPI00094B0880|nr:MULTISPECIES: 5'-3' exonuclease [unclassified Pseudonocardia]OLM18676.1 DNA polymerase I [Pseudonocardia sp. Ae707_Ps1]